jgi:GTP cyclohydrolase I
MIIRGIDVTELRNKPLGEIELSEYFLTLFMKAVDNLVKDPETKWLEIAIEYLKSNMPLSTPVFETVEEKRRVAVFQLLQSIGEDPIREGLLGTPDRVARMFNELYIGYNWTPDQIKHLLTKAMFEDGCKDMVIIKDIPFYSNCEHHMVPFFGTVDIAYVPDGKVVGLSKLPRLVDVFSKRLQIQERLTSQIADTVMDVVKPLGIMVVIKARHMCVESRGVEKSGAETVTSAVRGCFRDNTDCRLEAETLLNKRR